MRAPLVTAGMLRAFLRWLAASSFKHAVNTSVKGGVIHSTVVLSRVLQLRPISRLLDSFRPVETATKGPGQEEVDMPSANRISRSLTLALAVIPVAACSSAGEFPHKIAQVSMGADYAAVVAAMGPPMAADVTNVLGLESTALTWRSALTVCRVHLVLNHVVAKGCQQFPI